MYSAQTAPTKTKQGPIIAVASLQTLQILPNVSYAYSLWSSHELGWFSTALVTTNISHREVHTPNNSMMIWS